MNSNTLKNKEDLMSNENYIKYHEKKLEIRKKYSENLLVHDVRGKKSVSKNYIQSGLQEEYRQYIKELTDLMLEPSGDYQKFVWDTISQKEQEDMARIARGRLDRQIEY